MKILVLGLATSLATAPAWADAGSNDPFEYTCGDLLAAESPDQKARANMMLMWSVGYMFGRFDGGAQGVLRSEGVMGFVSDMVNAFHQVCPNVPDMPIGTFTINLANDLADSVEQ